MVVFIRRGSVGTSDDEIFPWRHPAPDNGISPGKSPSQFWADGKLENFYALKKPFPSGLPDFHEEEVVPIARYMAGEMNTNRDSPEAQQIRRFNQMADQPCPTDTWWEKLSAGMCAQNQVNASQVALLQWASLVRQGGRWDHKPIIAQRFRRKGFKGDIQAEYLYIAPDGKEYAVYYDVWSNIHYGYVGSACGFSASDLLDGAGLEQIGSDLLGGHLPSRKGTQGGPRDFDDTRDSAAISIGIDLYRRVPTHVTAEELLNRVVTNPLFAQPRSQAKLRKP